ncbi:hypothetical protein SO802_031197 [Lithocarpus litseifolius]|uniref:MULE transposase domain-containing protein n=1 Tax=Lithocarpus litseifolius TaxID=425828 RepID=A0AAW2BLN5_9ROSI
MIIGDQAAHFTNIREYCAELLRTNSGSSVLLNVVMANLPIEEIERPERTLCPLFQRLYVCLDACKKGFVACRPFIGVDACHLKGHYGGQLMTAVATDPNNQLFPLTFAIVEVEMKDSWAWFILKLISDINASSKRRLTFISNQQKGLIPTFEELMPGVDHRLCVRHLYNNSKKKHPGLILRDIFWRIATATYYKQWDRAMKELRSVSTQAIEWVSGHSPSQWCKHAFSVYPKCDSLTNNMCESFNLVILDSREKLVIHLVEDLRLYLMRKFQSCKDQMMKSKDELCKVTRKKLEKNINSSGNWMSTWAGDDKFEVHCGAMLFIVDLIDKSFTCRRWDLVGVPCCHAISCIFFYKKEPVEPYVNECLKMQTYAACYEPMVMPMNGPDMWEGIGFELVGPPGRPKKHRKRDVDEQRPQSSKLEEI